MSMAWKIVTIGVATIAIVSTVFAAGVYYVNNVEHPLYTVVIADGDIEIRAYPGLVVAEVTRSGDRKGAVNTAFSPLADYIFAKRRGGESIAMTAPVTQERRSIAMTAPVTQERASESPDGTSWRVRFIMPSQYTLESLPKPADADVELREVQPARRAAIRFSGIATDELVAGKERSLREWLAGRGLSSDGPATFAYYNAPFTPGPMRRNEVWIEIPDADRR